MRTSGKVDGLEYALVDQPMYNLFSFCDVGCGKHAGFDGFYKAIESVDVLFQNDAVVRDKLPRIEVVIAVIAAFDF